MDQMVRPHLAQPRRQLAHKVACGGLGYPLDPPQEVCKVAAGAELHDKVEPVGLLE
jgi:hypothetical protein